MTAIGNKEVTNTEEVAEKEGFSVGEPRSLKQIIADVQATSESILLTIGGEPQMVGLSVEAYQALLERAEHWETVASLYKAEAQCDRGEAKPAREFFEEFRQKHGLSR